MPTHRICRRWDKLDNRTISSEAELQTRLEPVLEQLSSVAEHGEEMNHDEDIVEQVRDVVATGDAVLRVHVDLHDQSIRSEMQELARKSRAVNEAVDEAIGWYG